MNGNSVDHTTMREMNTALILNTLRVHAPLSRAGVASYTGLNKASVSSMVKELIERGLVVEMGVDTTLAEVGRPGINLRLNPEAGIIISAEIGVDFISIIAANFAFEVVARRYENTTDLAGQQIILENVLAYLKEIYCQVQLRGHRVLAISVGVPGLVDMQSGTLLLAPNLDWRNVELRRLVQAEFNLPVYVANEANMAALGESYLGAAHNSRLLLYVSSGVGLGGGIVIDGRLLTGITGFAGEFGHMTVVANGLPCSCGNVGCWETEATQAALFRRVRDAIQAGRTSSLLDLTSANLDQLTIQSIVHAIQNNDAVAKDALEETGRWLGVGMANLINALNPEHVVFGGKLSLAHEYLMPVIIDEIERRAFSWMREKTHLAIATHVDDACVMGGVAMVHRSIVNYPMSWQTHLEL